MNVIRIATEADVRSIDEGLYSHLHANHISSKGHIYSVICSPDYYLAVADEGSTDAPHLIGTCTLHVITQAASSPHGMMNDLVVVPGHRLEGIGRALFEYLEERACERLCKTIFFTCSPKREPGNKFHIAMGYILQAAAVGKDGTNFYEKLLVPKT
ncbi:MAG: GNAT family N-acetyltransferase [bacterium]|nr:GNAT family N-acetyltransferase [bacterium]